MVEVAEASTELKQTKKERWWRWLKPQQSSNKKRAMAGVAEVSTELKQTKKDRWWRWLKPQQSSNKKRAMVEVAEASTELKGTVQGLEHSTVALSTCQGFEGMIYDGNETYYVQPFPGNMDRHIMYRMKDLKMGDKRCGVKHSDFPSSMDELVSLGKHRTRRNVESESKFVELLLVNDRSQYLHLKSNKTEVEYRSKMIANIVDSLYRPLNVRIALTMVEIWSQKDGIFVDEDSDKCLDNFLQYRNKQLVKKYDHDNAQLLTHRSFKGSTVGKASVMAMCGEKSGGVVQDHSFSAAATAATLAHEMGHNFGLIHDEDITDCKCNAPADKQGCIMSAVARSTPSTEWSTCSFGSFDKYLKRGLDFCLFDTPPTLFGDALCGNGFKEEGEDCDCGTIEECLKYSDNCCNATTCKLHPGLECDTGPCCGNCKLKPEGSLCRDKTTECDLPEVCTGKSELCPSNKYVQDGVPCGNNKGYCYKSECPLHDVQCKDLWGPGMDQCTFNIPTLEFSAVLFVFQLVLHIM
ncbi:Disintegrin and metalloproteinase domain-containing protein 33 [Desmophyllum pertusum]|uniref:Disintegrin and metalloproteinase domain-containing protein 33 n=1 Tax=Desmophyllum pertusum TaxID=174260 RepID=A0A9X0D9L5_9CNID|nr:Disintegrin and metalloproteinase domain-containing protein 33 [Desmophyllum pertusum]